MDSKEVYKVLLEDLENVTRKREEAYNTGDYQSASFYSGMIAHIEIMFDRIKHDELIRSA